MCETENAFSLQLIHLKALFWCLLILIFRYLGDKLYPFDSEASPSLYENALYFW